MPPFFLKLKKNKKKNIKKYISSVYIKENFLLKYIQEVTEKRKRERKRKEGKKRQKRKKYLNR